MFMFSCIVRSLKWFFEFKESGFSLSIYLSFFLFFKIKDSAEADWTATLFAESLTSAQNRASQRW